MTRSPRAGARRRRALRALLVTCILGAACDAGGGAAPLARRSPPASPDAPESWQPYYAALGSLGEGFVAWESLRDGQWRIWLRPLDGGPERQLSPDEPGRDHVAVHVAPDGRHLVYLSLPAPHRDFEPLPDGQQAPLHLVRLEGGRPVEDRVLAPDARPYHQSRVALWTSPRSLVYIAGDRSTREIDVLTGAEEVLIPEPATKFGMLVNATRSHATNGSPTFSIYHPGDRSVALRKKLPGCQPYFTPDGRYGYWVADAGGPIRKLDLADGTSEVVLERDAAWLPKGRGYLYYPMASADQRLLAFGASKNEQNHFDSDYEIFVAPLDPETLKVAGTAVRYSFSPGQDRFPDVFVAGSELGRLAGEAPFEVTLHPDPDAPDGGWRFDYGDGSPEAEAATHVYEQPGRYRVRAWRGERSLGGEVRVAAPAPPRVRRAEVLPGRRELAVLFDERVDAAHARVRLASGAAVESVAPGDRGSDVLVRLVEPLAGADTLLVEGVRDRAARPNEMVAARVAVEAGGWPGAGEPPVFVFATEGAPNLGRDVDTGRERSFAVVPRGRARYDAYGALRVVTGGSYEAENLPAGFARAFRDAGAVTVEATVWPTSDESRDPLRILSLSHDERSQNLSLSQHGRHAEVRIRTSVGGDKRQTAESFGQLAAGKATHLIVSYRPGRLVAYQDGRRLVDTDAVQGDLRDWRDGPRLVFGADPDGGRDFPGTVEGIALYPRFFEADEAAAHANAYLRLLAEREPVPRVQLKARLAASSLLPTPEQIAPYREALVLNEYEVPPKKRAKVGAERVRVAQWAILDGQPQRVPGGNRRRVPLVLEPWDRHARLESTFLSDTLVPDPEVPVYVDVGR
jgi:hypothetical protein